MDNPDQQGIEEAYVITTDEIDFFGAIVREKEGTTSANGRVLFQDGTWWYFSSSRGDPAALRKRLVQVCETVAALYQTDVFRLKFRKVMGYNEFIRALREVKHRGMARA